MVDSVCVDTCQRCVCVCVCDRHFLGFFRVGCLCGRKRFMFSFQNDFQLDTVQNNCCHRKLKCNTKG